MLIGNYSVLNKNPGRAFGGSTVSDTRAQSGKSGPARGRFAGWASYSSLSATPRGTRPPSSWVLPIDAGDLAATNELTAAATLAGSGAMGVNGVAALTGTATLVGTGALIVSAVAAITAGVTVTADVLAILQLSADLAASGNVTGALVALGNAVAAITGAGTVTPTPSAIGHMEAAIQPYTELSPQSLASAVWSSLAASFNEAGTMGEALNFAHIAARNKVVTDPAAGTITIYDTDGTTVLYSADLWQNAAGTVAYAGAGAERRERLE